MHIQNKLSSLEQEILKDYECLHKKRSIKLSFLRKYAHANLYVSKKTGSIIPEKIYSNEKNLKEWDRKYKVGEYSSLATHFVSRHLYTIEIARSKIDLKNKKIADLGCGGAGLISLLNKFYGVKNIFGFENSRLMCQMNKKKFKRSNVKFINSTIENIDEKKFKNFFDVIFLTWTLGSSAKPTNLLNKIYKILKKNGYLVISESSRILVFPKLSAFYYFNNYNTFLNYPWRFSFNSLRNLLLLFNFKIINKNRFDINDNLIVVAKKSNQIRYKNYKIDNYKKVIKFLKKWVKASSFLRN